MKINQNYLMLEESYLFSTINQKINAYIKKYPNKPLTKLGIGDVTRPICPVAVEAMHQAVEEMGKKETFHGYGKEQGYDFLRQAIQAYYKERNVVLDEEEIFISDGAKSDLGNILDIMDTDNAVCIPDPVYPVYVDTNIMHGRKIHYVNATIDNGFLPLPDKNIQADIIYLCSPNNPTGAVYNKEQLKLWVEYALQNKAVILFDAAYEAFIQHSTLPHSIYEIEGAKECAIEICSLSKTAGFTGVRCGYTIVPMKLKTQNVSLNKLWLRRQTTKFNGVSYIVQKGAASIFSPKGQQQIKENIAYYINNARIIADALREKNIWFTGGEHSPYLWLKCTNGMSSWEYFDYLLENAQVVGTPGAGFGANGEGYFRLTAFASLEDTILATNKIKQIG